MTAVLCWQDLAAELERERTGRVMAQQAANQEKLQARASAAESASLRRQLKEMADLLEQEKHTAGAAVRSGSGQADAHLVCHKTCLEHLHTAIQQQCSYRQVLLMNDVPERGEGVEEGQGV